MTTTIRSKEPLTKLLERLTENTLDPRFEKIGNFILSAKEGGLHFWGNFLDVSARFDILTDDRSVIASLSGAIRANQRTIRYTEARKAREAA